MNIRARQQLSNRTTPTDGLVPVVLAHGLGPMPSQRHGVGDRYIPRMLPSCASPRPSCVVCGLAATCPEVASCPFPCGGFSEAACLRRDSAGCQYPDIGVGLPYFGGARLARLPRWRARHALRLRLQRPHRDHAHILRHRSTGYLPNL